MGSAHAGQPPGHLVITGLPSGRGRGARESERIVNWALAPVRRASAGHGAAGTELARAPVFMGSRDNRRAGPGRGI